MKGKSLNHPVDKCSPVVEKIVILLDKVDAIIDETPLIDQPQRFGNKAFATFYHRLCQEIEELLKESLPEKFHKSIPEISIYVTESVGNSTRIDYGSGHEMSFIMFMYCLFRVGALDCNLSDDRFVVWCDIVKFLWFNYVIYFSFFDRIAVVTKIFKRYLDIVRKLQTFYNMEPAGSHGVWSLDDFQFIPFLWGSSQFVGN